MLIDSAAYPHILERIIWHCSAKTLVAFRSVSKHCQQVADARLFRHAALRIYALGERKYPPSLRGYFKRLVTWHWDRDVRGILGRRVTRGWEGGGTYNCMPGATASNVTIDFVVSPLSRIESDMTLPLLPWKVQILDLDGEGRHIWEFVRAGMPCKDWPEEYVERYTNRHGKAPPSFPPRATPLIFRRFGPAVNTRLPAAVGTTVDFCTARWPTCTTIPPQSPSYVRHLQWCEKAASLVRFCNSHYLFHELHVDEATLVLAQHSPPPRPDVVVQEILLFASHFAADILNQSTVLTVVGAQTWLPDTDHDDIREKMLLGARRADGSVQCWGSSDCVWYSLDEARAAYSKVRVLTHEEWWDELGELKEAIGMWPPERQGVGRVRVHCAM